MFPGKKMGQLKIFKHPAKVSTTKMMVEPVSAITQYLGACLSLPGPMDGGCRISYGTYKQNWHRVQLLDAMVMNELAWTQ